MKIQCDAFFRKTVKEVVCQKEYQKMKSFFAHGRYSLYDHCFRVALLSYSLAKEKGLKLDLRSLIRGALLHDFYLYDWHKKHEGHRLHGLFHPAKALKNAKKIYILNKKEENMILSHMFPITLWVFPKSKEAWLLTKADKICAKKEHHNTFQRSRHHED